MLRHVGIEEEFLLVTSALKQGHIGDDMYAAMMAEGSGVSPEVFDSHMEVQTPPCDRFAVLREELRAGRRRAQTLAGQHSLNICAAGTLGVYRWQDVKVVPHAGIRRMVAGFSETFLSQSIAGLHMHTKYDTLGESLGMVNKLGWYVWLFLALSGSSRFYDGRDTGLASRRFSLIGQTPRTGMPPYYRSDRDYHAEQEALRMSGWARNKLWYYLRHNPNHNTLELRVMDAVPPVEDVLALAALFLCLCVGLERGVVPVVDMADARARVLTEVNLERAMCYGTHPADVQARMPEFFVEPDNSPLRLGAIVGVLYGMLAPVAKELGCLRELARIQQIAEDGNSSVRQAAAVKTVGNDLSAATLLVLHETLRDV